MVEEKILTDYNGRPLAEASQPLDQEQLAAWREAALEADGVKRLAGLLSPYTGLRNSTVAHLRPGWIVYKTKIPEVVVPSEAPCNLGNGDDACYRCQVNRDGTWKPESPHGARRVPVPDEDIIEALRDYFELYDKLRTEQRLRTYLKDLVEDAGLQRDVNAHALRHTYGTILARKGFEIETMRQAMGYSMDEDNGRFAVRRYIQFVDEREEERYACGAERAQGYTCEMPVDTPNERCYVHDDRVITCSATNRYGEPCHRIVDQLTQRCAFHQD